MVVLKPVGCQPTLAWEQVFVYINFYSDHDRNQSKSLYTNYRFVLTLPRGVIDAWRNISSDGLSDFSFAVDSRV